MKYMRYIAGVIFFCIMLCSVVTAAPYINLTLKYNSKTVNYNAERVYLEIDGEKIDNDSLPMEPIIMDGNTLVPAREVFEKLGASVAWKSEKNEVDILYNNIYVVMYIDNNEAVVAGKPMNMNVPPKIINSKTMIPVRFCAESVGLNVQWDNDSRTIKINSKDSTVTTTETTTAVETTTETTTAVETTTETTTASNEITDISFSSSSNMDVLSFKGSNLKPDTSFPAENTIILNFPATKLSAIQKNIGSGNYLKSCSYEYLTDNSVQVTVELSDNEVLHSLSMNTELTKLVLYKGTLSMMTYNDAEHKIMIPKNGTNIDISTVQHNDDYENLSYYLTFNEDLSSLINLTSMEVGDEYINKVTVVTENGKTKIGIDEKQIIGCKLTDDGNYISIKVGKPKEIYKNVIVLDPGHGGEMPGAIGNGLVEKDLTLSICTKILKLFEQNEDIKVYATRTTDVNPDFPVRVALANDYADVFVSVHINSAASSSASGTEVHYYDLHTNSVGLTSEIVAQTLQDKLIENLNSVDRGVKKGQDIYVTRNTTIPSVLCEIGFISNPMEAMKMASDSYQQSVAKAIYEGCVQFFTEYPSAR